MAGEDCKFAAQRTTRKSLETANSCSNGSKNFNKSKGKGSVLAAVRNALFEVDPTAGPATARQNQLDRTRRPGGFRAIAELRGATLSDRQDRIAEFRRLLDAIENGEWRDATTTLRIASRESAN